MGFWTGIKHALNSSLGTSDFLPLDKRLTKDFESMFTCVASDEVLRNYTPEAITLNNENGSASQTINVGSFKMRSSGSLKIIVSELRNITKTDYIDYTIRINKNGTNIYTQTDTTNSEDNSYSTIINFSPDDVISISIICNVWSGSFITNRQIFFFSIDICGTPKISFFK